MGGASIHDESFEDEFSDMEGSVTDGNPGNVVGAVCISSKGLYCFNT